MGLCFKVCVFMIVVDAIAPVCFGTWALTSGPASWSKKQMDVLKCSLRTVHIVLCLLLIFSPFPHAFLLLH